MSKESLKERKPHPLHLELPDIACKEEKWWLLDGQQRMTALIGSFTDNLYLGRSGRTRYKAFYDLKKKAFKVIKESDLKKANVKPENKVEEWFIPLQDLFAHDDRGYFLLDNNYHIEIRQETQDKFGLQYNSELNHLWKMFVDVKVPVINEIKNLPQACDIFTRLNSTGTPLTVVDIMIAKTYTKDFVLRDKIDVLNTELGTMDYELKPSTILQCMAACLAEDTETETIYNKADEIKSNWEETSKAIKAAAHLLKYEIDACKFSKLLPHEILLAPLSYYYYTFNRFPKTLNDAEIKRAMARFFWYNALSDNYGRSQNTRAKNDIKAMGFLLAGHYDVFKQDEYDFSIFNEKDIKDEEISGSPFSKTVLCFLISKKPWNYDDNTPVDIESTILEQSAKSLHHVFPKTVFPGKSADSLANISIISLELNKAISTKLPSIYFAEFSCNPQLKENLLEHHLIGDLTKFGISESKFSKFLDERAALIASEMKKKIKELSHS